MGFNSGFKGLTTHDIKLLDFVDGFVVKEV